MTQKQLTQINFKKKVLKQTLGALLLIHDGVKFWVKRFWVNGEYRIKKTYAKFALDNFKKSLKNKQKTPVSASTIGEIQNVVEQEDDYWYCCGKIKNEIGSNCAYCGEKYTEL